MARWSSLSSVPISTRPWRKYLLTTGQWKLRDLSEMFHNWLTCWTFHVVEKSTTSDFISGRGYEVSCSKQTCGMAIPTSKCPSWNSTHSHCLWLVSSRGFQVGPAPCKQLNAWPIAYWCKFEGSKARSSRCSINVNEWYACVYTIYTVHLSALRSTSLSQMMHQNPDCGRLSVNGINIVSRTRH